MKNNIIHFFLLLSSVFSYGQGAIIDNKLALKIAPLSILDIYGGSSTRIGVEYKLKNNYSLYNEIGTYFPYANGMHNNRGFLTKIEFKAYLNKQGLTINKYISAELFYKQQSYYTYDSIATSTNTYIKDYFVSKKVGCFTVKYGMLTIYKSRFVLDGFIGIGVRYKIAENTLNNNENKNIVSEGSYQTNILKNKSGTFTDLNFDMGLKIGYRLK